ncbi:hypothetical protein H310_14108 [Aphanomyces invadans]|uniref:Glycoside hydrolase family 5 domain-containing protein n=1 Tax=Aphanomyces invadans TaxID=157072 RepID=A0A024TB71_9STRA|nr:hypothetical protein H310_14108 [Aphanomyces invadans]ETV91254.1 hypothetical protein H310_14108 [Aphanomyces invadans]|eukprot:XP_008880091.1 hypothetical protein H310_14108 [Aphanomyces invadans]
MEVNRRSLNDFQPSSATSRGSLAFTREDRSARFEVDVVEPEHMLMQTPLPTAGVDGDDHMYNTASTDTSHSFPSSSRDGPRRSSLSTRPVGINTQYSTRPTVFERPSEVPTTSDSDMPTRGVQPMTLTYVAEPTRSETAKDYRGRRRVWPGLVLLACIITLGVVSISFGAKKSYENATARLTSVQTAAAKRRAIQDGLGDDWDVADDGIVNNPRKYTTKSCSLPNYLSKNGQIVAASPNGTEVAVGIKGVNWFGMETLNAVPFGLWQNDQNGTTVFEIAAFLQRNGFNSVRLPVSVGHILDDTPPALGLVNRQANRAMNLKSYMTTIQSIVQALGFRQISVLISIHTLMPDDNTGGLWYDKKVPEASVLKSFDLLAKGLCSDEYWNVLGIDLKNEPHKATWGDGVAATDWVLGATKLGNHMLSVCPNWVGFVEGINGGPQKGVIDGKEWTYYNWWGGGLQGAATKGVEFATRNKMVYSPHYYTTAVAPQDYFYDGKWQLMVELPDDRLRTRVADSMFVMFGFLAGTDAAVVMGEFGGLYATDKHPLLTTKRTTDFTIETMVQNKYAGAYMWSLNPESAYQFNPITPGSYTEGLLLDDWLTPNKPFLKGMEALNKLPNVRPFPCFFDKKP